MTLFATGDSRTAGRLASVVPRPYSEDPDVDPKVSECLHIAYVFERAGEFDVIHNSFDFLPLTYSGLVDTPLLTTIHGFSSPRDPPRVPALQRSQRLRGDQRRRSPSERWITSRRSTTASTRMRSRCTPRLAATCSSSAASTRTRAPSRRSRSPSAAGCRCRSPGSSRTERYFEEQVAPHIDGDRVRFVGAVGPEERSELLGGARRAAAPDRLRRAIRVQRRRGDGLRHAGDRVPARLDAGADRATAAPGFLVDDVDDAVAAVGHGRRTRPPPDPERRRWSGSGRARMVDEYLDAYEVVTQWPALTQSDSGWA